MKPFGAATWYVWMNFPCAGTIGRADAIDRNRGSVLGDSQHVAPALSAGVFRQRRKSSKGALENFRSAMPLDRAQCLQRGRDRCEVIRYARVAVDGDALFARF